VVKGLMDVEGVQVIHAGTKKVEDEIVTNGGRVLNIVATGQTLKETMNKIYNEIPKINFELMYYRKDIAWKELQRKE
jgi:phosphoribosylamine--glycine ligase